MPNQDKTSEMDLLAGDGVVDQSVVLFSMKRFLPSAEEAAKMDFNKYKKILKKALDKDLNKAPFFFLVGFDFDQGIQKPLIFIGPPSTAWKKAIASKYKGMNEFARGVCSLKQDGGQAILQMQVLKGKGARAKNLKALNKELLREIPGKPIVEFVEDLVAHTQAETELLTEVEGEMQGLEQMEQGKEIIAQHHTLVIRIKQEIKLLQAMPKEDHTALIARATAIQKLAEEWHVVYKGNKSERKDEKKYVDKVLTYLDEHVFASKAFKTLEIKAFSDEWKLCLQAEQGLLKEQQEDEDDLELLMSLDLEWKDLYENIQNLALEIKVWQKQNPKEAKEHAKFFAELAQRIQSKLRALAELHTTLKEEDPARADLSVFEQRLEDLTKRHLVLSSALKEGKAEASEVQALYQDMLRLHTDCGSWIAGNADIDGKAVKKIATALEKALKDLRSSKWASLLPKAMQVRDAHFLDFDKRHKALKQQFEQALAQKTKALNAQKEDEALAAEATMQHLLLELGTLRSDLRDWSKVQDWEGEDAEHAKAMMASLVEDAIDWESKLDEATRQKLLERQGFATQALRELGEKTELPSLESKILPSASYKKVLKIYEAYQQADALDLELRRALLLDLSVALTAWKKKNPKPNATERDNVALLQAKVLTYLKQLALFGAQRDNFYEIINDYEKLRNIAPSGNLALVDAKILQQGIDEVEEGIQEWQLRHTNLSGFGTPAQNKILERTRLGLLQFVAEVKAQKSQSLLEDAQNGVDVLLLDASDENSRAASIAYLAWRMAQKQGEGVEAQLALAQKMVNTEANRQGLSKDAKKHMHELLRKQFAQEADILTGLDSALSTGLKAFANTNDSSLAEVQYESINKDFPSKAVYKPEEDKELEALKKMMTKISQMLQENLASKGLKGSKKVAFLNLMEAFETKKRLWEAIMESYVSSEAWKIAKKEVLTFCTKGDYVQAASLVKGIKEVREARQEMKYNLASIKLIEKAELQLKEKAQKNRVDTNGKAYREEALQLKMLSMEKTMKLGESIDNYKAGFGKLDNDLQNTKHKKKEKANLEQKIQAQVKTLTQGMEDSLDRIDQKTNAFDEIVNAFTPLIQNQGSDALQQVAALRLKILAWNEIVIISKDKAKFETLQEQALKVQEISQALTRMEQKLGDPVLAKFKDEDKVFEKLKIQVEQLQLDKLADPNFQAPKNFVQRLSFLLKSISVWKENNPKGNVRNYNHYLEAEDWEKNIAKALTNGKIADEASALAWSVAKTKCKAQITELGTPKDQAQLDFIQQWTKNFDQKTKELDARITKQNVQKHSAQLQDWNNVQHYEFVLIDLKINEKEERLALALFEGKDLAPDLSDLDLIFEGKDTEKQKVLDAIEKACARARKVIELEQYEQAERLLAHIPVAFWPDDVFEEMRLWQKIQRTFIAPSEEEVQGFSIQDLDEFTSKTIAFYNDNVAGIFDDVKDELESIKGLEFNKALLAGNKNLINDLSTQLFVNKYGTNPDLSNPEHAQAMERYRGGVAERMIKESEKVKDASVEEQMKVMEQIGEALGYVAFGAGLLQDAVGSASELADLIDKWKDVSKISKLDPNRQKAVVKARIATSNLILKQFNKASKQAVSGIGTFGDSDAVPGLKVATGVLKTFSLVFDQVEAVLTQAESTEPLPTWEQIVSSQGVKDALNGAVDGIITLGQGVSEIVEIFLPAASIVTAAFSLAGDAKALYDAAVALHRASVTKDQTEAVLHRAVQQDSIYLPAMRREMKTAKQNVAKAGVEVAADSVKLIGSTTSFVGACVSFVPKEEAQAAAIALKIAGLTVQKFGDTIKIAGKIVFTLIDNKEKAETAKLLKLAKIDRNARLKLMENSKAYAKMALAIGVESNDPIAVEYCIVRGMTESDINEKNAAEILNKFLEIDEQSLDERTIGQKVKDVISIFEPVKQYFSNISQIGKTTQLNISDLRSVQQEVLRLEAMVVSTRKHLKALKFGAFTFDFISGVSDLSEDVSNYAQDLKNNLTSVYRQLGSQIETQQEGIKNLNAELEIAMQALETEWTEDESTKVFQIQENLKNKYDMMEALRQGRVQINLLVPKI